MLLGLLMGWALMSKGFYCMWRSKFSIHKQRLTPAKFSINHCPGEDKLQKKIAFVSFSKYNKNLYCWQFFKRNGQEQLLRLKERWIFYHRPKKVFFFHSYFCWNNSYLWMKKLSCPLFLAAVDSSRYRTFIRGSILFSLSSYLSIRTVSPNSICYK